MLNSYYDISSAHKIKPYAGIGLGYTNIKPGEALRTSDSNAMTYKANNSNNFTYSLMTGVSVINFLGVSTTSFGVSFSNDSIETSSM